MSRHLEAQFQEQVVNWLSMAHPNALFTASIQENAGSSRQGPDGGRMWVKNVPKCARRKRMGYRAGTPDLMIFEPRKTEVKGGGTPPTEQTPQEEGKPPLNRNIARFKGLFVEMKTEEGRPSQEQKTFLAQLTARGYMAIVCHGVQEAVDKIDAYLGMERDYL